MVSKVSRSYLQEKNAFNMHIAAYNLSRSAGCCYFFIIVILTTIFTCILREFPFVIRLRQIHNVANIIDDPLLMDIELFTNTTTQTTMDYNGRLLPYVSDTGTDQTDDWRQVTSNVLVYSAFWDSRYGDASFVRIIGGVCGTNLQSLKCLMLLDEKEQPIEESPTVYHILEEHHNKDCKAAYFKCSSIRKIPPISVALVPTGNDTSQELTHWMTVRNTNISVDNASGIGICVRPFFNYSDTFHVAEFIALYQGMGATHFTFYNFSVADNVSLLVKHLQLANFSVELLPWSAPPGVQQMWSLGQMVNIQDCIYRNMYRNSYLAVVDIDEFIVPRHVISFSEVFQRVDSKTKRYASFVFRSCVFCMEYEEDPLPSVIPRFMTQRRIQREIFVYPFKLRTKYIIKPKFVVTGGIHYVWEFFHGWKDSLVPETKALVHHYRAGLCRKLQGGIVDVTARKYLRQLMTSKAVSVWKDIFGDKT